MQRNRKMENIWEIKYKKILWNLLSLGKLKYKNIGKSCMKNLVSIGTDLYLFLWFSMTIFE